MPRTKFFPVEATHERFAGIESEVGLSGTRTLYPPEMVGAMLVARQVSLNYDDCTLQVGCIQILGAVINSARPVPHKGKPCFQVMTMERASDEWREKARLRAAEYFQVMPEEVHFYNGHVIEREVFIIEN